MTCKLMSNEWLVEMKRAFNEGMEANSIFDNPYWKDYPKKSTKFDESKARHWVDGYVEKLLERNLEKTI